jgi:hypothetical protein
MEVFIPKGRILGTASVAYVFALVPTMPYSVCWWVKWVPQNMVAGSNPYHRECRLLLSSLVLIEHYMFSQILSNVALY